jgi:prephenate dehydrogenase
MTRIAFIGLGNMGGGMAARLVGAGWVATAQDGVRGFTGRRLVVEVVPDVFGAGHLEPVAAALNLGAQV